MINPNPAPIRSVLCKSALAIASCLFGLSAISASAALPSSAQLQPLATEHAALPLDAKFEKVAASETSGPFVLKLTNTSKDALKLNVDVKLSVSFHANPKDRSYKDHELSAGATWTIDDLAAGDKITVTAEGFTPLELTVH